VAKRHRRAIIECRFSCHPARRRVVVLGYATRLSKGQINYDKSLLSFVCFRYYNLNIFAKTLPSIPAACTAICSMKGNFLASIIFLLFFKPEFDFLLI
jgi:hypothetical protein